MNPPIQRSTPADAERYRLCWTVHPLDLFTPVRVFQSLRAAGHHACLLESVEGPARLSRYSFVGVDPTAHFRGRAGASRLEEGGGGAAEDLAGPKTPEIHALRRPVAKARVTRERRVRQGASHCRAAAPEPPPVMAPD